MEFMHNWLFLLQPIETNSQARQKFAEILNSSAALKILEVTVR